MHEHRSVGDESVLRYAPPRRVLGLGPGVHGVGSGREDDLGVPVPGRFDDRRRRFSLVAEASPDPPRETEIDGDRTATKASIAFPS